MIPEQTATLANGDTVVIREQHGTDYSVIVQLRTVKPEGVFVYGLTADDYDVIRDLFNRYGA